MVLRTLAAISTTLQLAHNLQPKVYSHTGALCGDKVAVTHHMLFRNGGTGQFLLKAGKTNGFLLIK